MGLQGALRAEREAQSLERLDQVRARFFHSPRWQVSRLAWSLHWPGTDTGVHDGVISALAELKALGEVHQDGGEWVAGPDPSPGRPTDRDSLLVAGERIRNARVARGWSQRDLAAQIDPKPWPGLQTLISEIERGRKPNLAVRTAVEAVLFPGCSGEPSDRSGLESHIGSSDAVLGAEPSGESPNPSPEVPPDSAPPASGKGPLPTGTMRGAASGVRELEERVEALSRLGEQVTALSSAVGELQTESLDWVDMADGREGFLERQVTELTAREAVATARLAEVDAALTRLRVPAHDSVEWRLGFLEARFGGGR